MTGFGLNRREVVAALLKERGDLLVVSGLGSPTWDCAATGDHPLTFSLWGGMGQAAMTGLGLALAQPDRRVLVITGDGEALMGLGALATIGVQQPRNLSVVILDNGRYGETGMQPSHTSFGIDFVQIGRGCRFSNPRRIGSMQEVRDFGESVHGRPGPNMAVVEIRPEKLPLVLPPREGRLLKDRFRHALLGFEGKPLPK